MSRPKSTQRHPVVAAEAGIDRAARLILAGRSDEALTILKSVQALHKAIVSGPVTHVGLMDEIERTWAGLQDLEAKISFSMEMNDRLFAWMRDSGVLDPVWEHLDKIDSPDPDDGKPPKP